MSPLILVDGMNLAYRSFFAYRGLQSNGEPTGVLHGFLLGLLQLLPLSSDIAVCWDDKQNWRKQIRTSYKATRKQDPEIRQSVMQQVHWLTWALRYLGLQSICCPMCEADDVISVLSGIGSYMGKRHVLVVSSDKDLYQILSDWVDIIPKPGQKHHIVRREVESKYGIPIGLWADYLALGGDSSDNIKPMRGVGGKTALGLVRCGVWPSVRRFRDLDIKGNPPRKLLLRCKQEWETIRECYTVAALPDFHNDVRLTKTTRKALLDAVVGCMAWERRVPNDGRERFIRFLGRFELLELLAVRNKFFRRHDV